VVSPSAESLRLLIAARAQAAKRRRGAAAALLTNGRGHIGVLGGFLRLLHRRTVQ